MSGPKYYDYPMSDDITSAELLNTIRHIPGVQIRVRNGVIETEVNNAAWIAGYDYEGLRKVIEKAKKQVRENKKMMKEDKTRRLKDVKKAINDISEAVEREEEQIKEQLEQLNETLCIASQHFETPFKSYSLQKQCEKLNTAIKSLQDDLSNIQKKAEKKKEELIKYQKELEATDEYADYCQLIKKEPKTKLREEDFEDYNGLCDEVCDEAKNLKSFCTSMNRAYELLERADLTDYIARLKNLSDCADPLSNDSVDMIDQIMEDIRKEMAALESQRDMLASNAKARSDAEARIKALADLSEMLKPIYVKASKENKDKIEAENANKELIKNIETTVSRTNNIEYLPDNAKAYLRSIKSSLKNARSNITSSAITKNLSDVHQQIEEIVKGLEKDNELYIRYNVEQKRYYDLSKCLGMENTAIQFPDFEIARSSSTGIEAILNDLIARNEALQREVNNARRKLMAVAVGTCAEGKAVSCESNDEITRINYLRPETKGVIYDVQIDATGKTAIYPRGVILSNGKSICSKEQLKAAHSSCGWAEELDNAMKGLGIENTYAHEISDEVTESMYDEKEFIRLNEEQSIFYLKKCGYTPEEIASFGFTIEEEEFEEEESREEEAHIERKLEREI